MIERLDFEMLEEFTTFARAEVASGDIEPWAATFRVVYEEGLLPEEDTAWLLAMYNTYDRLDSALRVVERWPSPAAWAEDPRREEAADYPVHFERRTLRGGKVNWRHANYLAELADGTQLDWLRKPLTGDSPGANFGLLTKQMRGLWGVGRQSAFEWAEFTGKVFRLPVDAADGQLYDSTGPRAAIEALYNDGDRMDEAALDAAADHLRAYLVGEGIEVPFVDLETLVCDFKQMRGGKFFVGKHITDLKADLAGNEMLEYAFNKVLPPEWAAIPAGLTDDPRLRSLYRVSGHIITRPEEIC